MKESYLTYVEKLQDNYKVQFQKIETYCLYLMTYYNEEKREEVMSDILDSFLNAQNENKDIKDIIGKDVEVYCKNVCKTEDNKMLLIKLLTMLKRISVWTLYLVGSYYLTGKLTGNYEGIVYLGQIVFGFVFALVNPNVDFLLRCKYFFNDKNYKKIYYKHIISIVLKLALGLILMAILQDKVYISGSIVFPVCIIYIAFYYLIIRNNTPETEDLAEKDKKLKMITDSIKTNFEIENKRRIKKGKETISEDEFINEEIKKVINNLKYEKYSWIWAVILGGVYFISHSRLQIPIYEKFLDSIMIFTLILLITLRLRKSFIKMNKAELALLEKCKNEKIKAEDWDKVKL